MTLLNCYLFACMSDGEAAQKLKITGGTKLYWDNNNRVRPRFFNQVGHETMYVCNGNKHFFTKSCHRQTYQNHEQPPRTFQNLYLQSHFSVLKIGKLVESFQNNFSMKNIWLGDQLLLKMFLKNFIFQILYFLKLGLIFVGSVHNFGRSDDLVI